MTKMPEAEVDLPDDRSVRVRRRFAAPPVAVYRAYSEPALMQKWMLGPPGWEMHVCEMDVRVGGAYRWRWRNIDDGMEFGFDGEFHEIDAPHRIVHGERFDPGTIGGSMGGECRVITTLEAVPDGTLMTALIIYANQSDRDMAMSTGMTDGMEMSYQNLDGLVAAGAL